MANLATRPSRYARPVKFAPSPRPPSLEALPRLGWVDGPSPAAEVSACRAGTFWVKRDDLLEKLHGGSKVRKLDHLLAAEPFASAETWASAGAIGSGHLATLAEAARVLGRRLEAHCFWEPVSAGGLVNLAHTAAGASSLSFHRSRLALALRAPGLVRGPALRGGVAIIPPGATAEPGTLGLVRAAFELSDQIQKGQLPPPERVYVALGSGGMAAGLSLGLALAGIPATVRAVATVERHFTWLAGPGRRAETLRRFLVARGVQEAARVRPRPIEIDHSQLGRGYGHPTAQSLAACELLACEGVPLEPIYTGKAAAALLASERGGGRALLWNSTRRPAAPPPGWRDRLPPALLARLDRVTGGRSLGRRSVLAGAAGLAAAGLVGWRLSGYEPIPGWAGQVLSLREARVIAAAAEAILPPGSAGPSPVAVAANVDRFVASFRPDALPEIHAMLALIEHGTTPLGLRAARFTRLSPGGREAFLLALAGRGGLLAQASRGLRDLCLLGFYQGAESWDALEYQGPWDEVRLEPEKLTPYDSFRAPSGTLPRGTS